MTSEGLIELEAAGQKQQFEESDFGEGLFLAGFPCPQERCQIVQSKNIDGKIVSSSEASQEYVDVWIAQVDPEYESPYTTNKPRRELQSGSTLINKSIMCIQPYDSLAFEVSDTNYPVYIKESPYNTDDNYDYGVFTTLENKLVAAQLGITSFMVGFSYSGIFVFGDVANPQVTTTIVLVTEDVD